MSHEWSPRPRREINTNGLFPFVEEEAPVRKGLTPIERQRAEDGTPITRTPLSGLRPADTALFLKGHEPVKKSIATKDDLKKQGLEGLSKAYEVVKAYLKHDC